MSQPAFAPSPIFLPAQANTASSQTFLPSASFVAAKPSRSLRTTKILHPIFKVTAARENDFGEVPKVEPEQDEELIKKRKEIERLRKAEKFIEVDEGDMECKNCTYTYVKSKGESYLDIKPGTDFADLPDSFLCPTCRAPKSAFRSTKKVIAGFAENQQYGFGGNTMTEGQKNTLIFGGLLLGALLLLSGYFLN